MQSTKNEAGSNAAMGSYCARERRILVRGQVGSTLIVILPCDCGCYPGKKGEGVGGEIKWTAGFSFRCTWQKQFLITSGLEAEWCKLGIGH